MSFPRLSQNAVGRSVSVIESLAQHVKQVFEHIVKLDHCHFALAEMNNFRRAILSRRSRRDRNWPSVPNWNCRRYKSRMFLLGYATETGSFFSAITTDASRKDLLTPAPVAIPLSVAQRTAMAGDRPLRDHLRPRHAKKKAKQQNDKTIKLSSSL